MIPGNCHPSYKKILVVSEQRIVQKVFKGASTPTGRVILAQSATLGTRF